MKLRRSSLIASTVPSPHRELRPNQSRRLWWNLQNLLSAEAGKSAPAAVPSSVSITGLKLSYMDSERKAHYEGGVIAKGAGFTASATTLDAYLVPRSQSTANKSVSGPGQLDHMVAEGDVLIQQPNRRAEGQKLVYVRFGGQICTDGRPS